MEGDECALLRNWNDWCEIFTLLEQDVAPRTHKRSIQFREREICDKMAENRNPGRVDAIILDAICLGH